MKNIMKFWKYIVTGSAAMVAVSAAIVAYDDLRPYPTKDEFIIVAGRSCKNEMSFFQAELRTIKRDIIQAEQERNVRWKNALQEQQEAVRREIERIKRECGWS